MMNTRKNDVPRRARAAASAAFALSLVLGITGCTFDAENPAAITEEGLQNEEALTALVNGVIGDYDESYQRTALYAGLISDEIRASGSWSWWHDADQQGIIDVDAPTGDLMNIPHHWWRPVSRARFLADETYRRIQDHLPNPEASPLAALTRLYSGMARRDIGEYFCVGAYDGGEPVQPDESLLTAEEYLTDAIRIADAAGVDSIAHMAHLVRARVRMSLGDGPGALADARAVPDGFHWVAHFRNAPGEDNGMVFQLNQRVEGTIDEPFHDTGDPRVPVEDTGLRGADNLTPRWDQLKLGRYTDMPMGKWQEARLIEAELLLDQGQVADAVSLMNQVRAPWAELEPLDTGMSVEEATAALRLERRHELFLEGHRLPDMRRWGLFPAGWEATCSPLPRAETDNNANF